MIPSFEILIAKDLSSVLNRISAHNENVHLLAGGTDVIPGLNLESNRFRNASLLIDINRVPELKGITAGSGKISIGAAETFSEILKSEIIRSKLPLLWKSASTIGSVQIRNRATIAGNFVNNAPCADSVPVLLVYNATVEIESQNSKREISLNEFLSSPYKTKLYKDEIVTRINIPVPSTKFAGDFIKLGRRRAVAISRITLAMLMRLNDYTIEEFRVASGAITPIGARFFDLEKFAEGQKLDDQFAKELSRKLGGQIIQAAGLRWSSEYKLPVVQQLFYQLLKGIERGS